MAIVLKVKTKCVVTEDLRYVVYASSISSAVSSLSSSL